jgi:hypothetical protein
MLEQAWPQATPFFCEEGDETRPLVQVANVFHLGHSENVDALTTTVGDAQIPENRAKSPLAMLGAAPNFAEDVGGQDSGCGRQQQHPADGWAGPEGSGY